ncbi:hypothetical protein QFC21_000532 [Naganishia friedmannii]|uniref:Uncharacterized protein n=1 Tax=Naganishia friedmannii TaxID=89922 RepID=A0ACC2WCU2_9TREE|nr:hypothetical protein QFC21_000532 [Naganishia friedmannii]
MEKRFMPQLVPTKESVKPSATAFIALNVIRFLSIVALCLIFASQIVGAAMESRHGDFNHTSSYQDDDLDCDYFEYTSVPDQPGGIFWAILNRTFILMVIVLLLPTELVIPVKKLTQFYIDYIPIISPAHGLGILGVIQCWIASTVLSKYVQKFEQASGFMCFIVGCLNILMGLIFRSSAKSRRSIFSWENVAQLTPQSKAAHRVYTTYNDKFDKLKPFTDTAASALNRMRNPTPERSVSQDHPHTSTENLLHKDATRSHVYTEPDVDMPDIAPATTNAEASSSKRMSKIPGMKFGGFGFGKQATKPVGQRGLVITRPLETLPRYASEAALKNMV